MKKLFSVLSISFLLLMNLTALRAQINLGDFKPEAGKKYLVEKHDGTIFFGEILSYDARELLLKTADKGEVIIPKHELHAISQPDDVKLDESGKYIAEDRFATRYFITTNGLPIKKGDHYVQWNFFGPDFQFAVSDNLGLGFMTSWVAIPIIGTIKYSVEVSPGVQIGLGALLGTFSWADFDSGLALPYATVSIGNRRSNIAFSGGYGALILDGESEGRTLVSIAGMHRFSNSISVVFDSFIGPGLRADETGYAILIPGIRWQRSNRQAIQFGLAGIVVDGEVFPVPIPMLQWFHRLNW